MMKPIINANPFRAANDGNLKRQFGGLDTYLHDGKLTNAQGQLVIYTDGACPSNGKRRNGVVIAKSGCGVFGGPWLEESFRNPSGDDAECNTNNFAEAHAIEYAVERALDSGAAGVEIRTDSVYCIKSLTEWSEGWIKRAKGGVWRNRSRQIIVHQPIFETVLDMMQQFEVTQAINL